MSRRDLAKARARAARLAHEAELKAKADRKRRLTRAGALVAFVIVALAVGVALATRHGPRGQANADVPALRLTSLASLGTLRSPPPAGALGPEGVPASAGPDLAKPGTLHRPVDGIQCLRNEQVAFHIHAHLTILDHGVARRVPYAVGIEHPQTTRTPQGIFVGGGDCFYWLHTHAADGIIHIESPVSRTFTLGDFFDIWGQQLGPDRVGPASGHVTAFYNGRLVHDNPRQIPLTAHAQIQLDIGRPLVAPVSIAFPQGL
jgi:hypothetical protein